VIWSCCRPSRPAGSAFGPDYWLLRCDGFRVMAEDGGYGVVDEIVESHDVLEGLTVRLADSSVHIDAARIVDIDPVARLVVVDHRKRR
jgi:hypothetical protein